MIICSNCQHKNVAGAMYCAECGAQLDGVETLITQAITDEQIETELKRKATSMVWFINRVIFENSSCRS